MSTLDRRADRLTQVQAQVNYHGLRVELHQRLHGSRPTARLTELQSAYTAACQRLAGANDAPPPPGTRSRPG